ncbi:MAG: hypothetical protein J7K68_03520 [Candidatus Diapherotrites archaeon]|nr:hypothetical protein [Candidatus Diapherotrites archaeon]
MDEFVEFRFRVLELAYKYNKTIKDVLNDFASIRIEKVEDKKKKKK